MPGRSLSALNLGHCVNISCENVGEGKEQKAESSWSARTAGFALCCRSAVFLEHCECQAWRRNVFQETQTLTGCREKCM